MTVSIKDWREERGLTQDHVADLLGVKQAYYSRIERGGANPTVAKCERLAAILDVGIGDLVTEMARLREAFLSPGYLTQLVSGVADRGRKRGLVLAAA